MLLGGIMATADDKTSQVIPSTGELQRLRTRAALIHEVGKKQFAYDFTDLLLACVVADDDVSQWFHDYAKKAGVKVDQMAKKQGVPDDIERLRQLSDPVSAVGREPAWVSPSAKEILGDAEELLQKTAGHSNTLLDVRHVMGAFIYRPRSEHDAEVEEWGFDIQDWSNAFLSYLGRHHPEEIEEWRTVHRQALRTEPAGDEKPAIPVFFSGYSNPGGPARRFDEIFAGISYGGPTELNRTITALVRDQETSRPMLLLVEGTSHVLSERVRVVQPAGATDSDTCGIVARVATIGEYHLAVAWLAGTRSGLSQLPSGHALAAEPQLRGIEDVSGRNVQKYGAASGVTKGQIIADSRQEGTFRVRNIDFAIDSADIGALVVSTDSERADSGHAIGVIVEVSSQEAICLRIQGVLNALRVELIHESVSYQPKDQARDTISAYNDEAIGPDRLGVTQYVDAFARLIRDKDARPPLTVGIYGAWGSGKSFLMKKIIEQLKPSPSKESPTWWTAIRRSLQQASSVPETLPTGSRSLEPLSLRARLSRLARLLRGDHGEQESIMLLVEFEAWDYNASDKLWAGLVERIFRGFEDSAYGIGVQRSMNVRRNFERQWRTLRYRVLPYALFILVFAVLTIIFILLGQPTWATALGSSTVLIVLLGFVREIINLLTIPASQRIIELFAGPDYSAELGFMARIKDDLKSFANALPKDSKVVVFIDDLDRCDPRKAVEVLEAVKLLLDFDRFIVFLALDARIITKAIEEHYGVVLSDAQISGYEYLDKIVQIPFCMPEIPNEGVRNYLGSLLDMREEDIPPSVHDDAISSEPLIKAVEPQVVLEKPLLRNMVKPSPDGSTIVSPPPRPEPDPSSIERLVDTNMVSFTPAEQDAWLSFSAHLDPNPRRIKRLVNIYRLVRALVTIQPDVRGRQAQIATALLDRPHAIIGWLILCEQWPYAAHIMLSLLDQSLQRAGTDQTARLQLLQYTPLGDLQRIAQEYIEQEGDSELRKLDVPYDRLIRLITNHLADITLGEIVRMRPYTVNFNPALSSEVRLTLGRQQR